MERTWVHLHKRRASHPPRSQYPKPQCQTERRTRNWAIYKPGVSLRLPEKKVKLEKHGWVMWALGVMMGLVTSAEWVLTRQVSRPGSPPAQTKDSSRRKYGPSRVRLSAAWHFPRGTIGRSIFFKITWYFPSCPKLKSNQIVIYYVPPSLLKSSQLICLTKGILAPSGCKTPLPIKIDVWGWEAYCVNVRSKLDILIKKQQGHVVVQSTSVVVLVNNNLKMNVCTVGTFIIRIGIAGSK